MRRTHFPLESVVENFSRIRCWHTKMIVPGTIQQPWINSSLQCFSLAWQLSDIGLHRLTRRYLYFSCPPRPQLSEGNNEGLCSFFVCEVTVCVAWGFKGLPRGLAQSWLDLFPSITLTDVQSKWSDVSIHTRKYYVHISSSSLAALGWTISWHLTRDWV